MKFSKQFLIDSLDDDANTVEVSNLGKSRWSDNWRRVFRHEGKFYETFYRTAATEQQDESPYEYDADEIECREVFAKEKVITVYSHD